MLDVIVSRGLPLDQITTSDVWATDTISACLPPVEEFKARMDELIWKKYRIEVEHLCARNPDGSKKTYEQMFYHIPKRKEGLCGLYCQYGDMLSPSYETSCRDGCWFCHNQGVDQLRLLRKNYPDRWALLLKWDKDSITTFHPDGHTVHDFDYRFQCEDEGLLPKDKAFRWAMLDAVQLKMF